MTVVAVIFSGLLALIQAIPVVDKWVQQFIVYYVSKRKNEMKAENTAALRKALDEKDQRDLEKAVGNPHPGEPTSFPGTELRDTLPGVPDSKGS